MVLVATSQWRLVVDVGQVEQNRLAGQQPPLQPEYRRHVLRTLGLRVDPQLVPGEDGDGTLVEARRAQPPRTVQNLEAQEAPPDEPRRLPLLRRHALLLPVMGPVDQRHALVVVRADQLVHAQQHAVHRLGDLLRHVEGGNHLRVAHEGRELLLEHLGEPQGLAAVGQSNVGDGRLLGVEDGAQRHNLHERTLFHLQQRFHKQYNVCTECRRCGCSCAYPPDVVARLGPQRLDQRGSYGFVDVLGLRQPHQQVIADDELLRRVDRVQQLLQQKLRGALHRRAPAVYGEAPLPVGHDGDELGVLVFLARSGPADRLRARRPHVEGAELDERVDLAELRGVGLQELRIVLVRTFALLHDIGVRREARVGVGEPLVLEVHRALHQTPVDPRVVDAIRLGAPLGELLQARRVLERPLKALDVVVTRIGPLHAVKGFTPRHLQRHGRPRTGT
ncbi:glutaredoxin, putative [Babesia caballi]|uniref:Glutaredoxin, putative n=1 Tax=Babesia caballi TaxID=5871 RepID=A0AAV4LMZ1_BABCB|nr:glutaredoxin, putative [Babesia caballi]